ncbi:hypothetical protein [Mucilaginibacter sp.]|uniref:hypothetical protein n=1 Tax=Mucilaginibacter sp. TaxID=1882438 RepID=UPI003266251B
MTTLTVNIDNKKSEKAIKAVLDALGLDYSVAAQSEERPLNKSEQKIYKNLKKSMGEIRAHQRGEIQLRDATELLDEL